eukprot:g1076.t1
MFPEALPPWPLDFLVVDIDGVDCLVVEELMQLVRPKVMQLEIAFHFPPPFRFSMHWDSEKSPRWNDEYDIDRLNPVSGCSLSYALHKFKPFGYHLLRLTPADAIFVHESVAPIMESGLGTKLPQDEFLCYRSSTLYAQMPGNYVREWFYAPHPATAFSRIWSNISSLNKEIGREDAVPTRGKAGTTPGRVATTLGEAARALGRKAMTLGEAIWSSDDGWRGGSENKSGSGCEEIAKDEAWSHYNGLEELARPHRPKGWELQQTWPPKKLKDYVWVECITLRASPEAEIRFLGRDPRTLRERCHKSSEELFDGGLRYKPIEPFIATGESRVRRRCHTTQEQWQLLGSEEENLRSDLDQSRHLLTQHELHDRQVTSGWQWSSAIGISVDEVTLLRILRVVRIMRLFRLFRKFRFLKDWTPDETGW